MPAKPIPFVVKPGQRDTASTPPDARFVNVLFEIESDAPPGVYPVNCLKRPGLSTSTQPFGGAAVGRGVFYWSVTGDIYSVFGTSTFVNTSTLVSTMATSTGRVWFQPIHEVTGAAKLMISDGAIDYQVLSTNVISTTSTFGTTHTGSAVELDGFYFHAFADGKIRNTAVNTVSTWPTTGFLTADTYGSDLQVIYRQKDQILGFTKNRTEFFFNNGNPTGSPLLRIDQNTLDFGIAHKNTLAWAGETACFVSENAGNGDGGRSVYIIQSLGKVREISPPSINRVLAAEGLSISSCSASMERINGHLVYMLNVASADRTYVYDVESGLWPEWESATSSRLNIVSMTSRNGVTYAQHATDGRIYTFQPSVYQDAGSNFEVVLQTARSNFGSHRKKYESEVGLVGDTSTGTVTVAVSDNDYQSFTDVGTIDMSSPFKIATRLGSFYSRAHKFTFAANAPFRVQAYLPEIRVGTG